MEKNKMAGKTARKFEGVMLALTINDARILRDFIEEKLAPISAGRMDSENRLNKIRERIEKQVAQRVIAQDLKAIEQADQQDKEQMQTLDASREEDAEAEKYSQENRVK